MSKFNNEYYVMNVDGANNHPLLAWGSTDDSPFLYAEIIEETDIDIPLQIVFDEPYPKKYEIPDLLMLAGNFASSGKFKDVFEKAGVYGIQFISIEITTNKNEVIKGCNAIHIWNQLAAIDKSNYKGEPVDRFGTILSLKKFSLDAELLNNIPEEKRLIFLLAEDSSKIIVHQSIYDTIQSAGLTGIKFFNVDDWDDNTMFR